MKRDVQHGQDGVLPHLTRTTPDALHHDAAKGIRGWDHDVQHGQGDVQHCGSDDGDERDGVHSDEGALREFRNDEDVLQQGATENEFPCEQWEESRGGCSEADLPPCLLPCRPLTTGGPSDVPYV